MPVEENKELRDLVTETLQAKGVLGKVQAEIRASVFLALEEQDVFKDRSPFINNALKEYIKSSNGVLIVSLIREFLEFFNLEFTSMVFDPETHAGIDYTFRSRLQLLEDLKLGENELENQPLLAYIFSAFRSGSFKQNEKVDSVHSSHAHSNGINGDASHLDKQKSESDKKSSHNKQLESDRLQKGDHVKESQASSLASLGNLPPLTKPNAGGKDKVDYNLKALLDVGIGSNYDEEFAPLYKNDKMKKDTKEPESEGSEVEEDMSRHTNLSGLADDNTADISVSKASGHGDYLEDV